MTAQLLSGEIQLSILVCVLPSLGPCFGPIKFSHFNRHEPKWSPGYFAFFVEYLPQRPVQANCSQPYNWLCPLGRGFKSCKSVQIDRRKTRRDAVDPDFGVSELMSQENDEGGFTQIIDLVKQLN